MLVLRNLLVFVTFALLFTLSSAQNYTFSVLNSATGSKCPSLIPATLNTCNTACLSPFKITAASKANNYVFNTYTGADCTSNVDLTIQITCPVSTQKIAASGYFVNCTAAAPTPTPTTTTGNHTNDSSSASNVVVGSTLLLALIALLALF
ncbi:hypothetical protein ACTA71_003891 [Dictyostelium dimigraforme]